MGLRFDSQGCMTVPPWPIFDQVMWLRLPMDMQVGTGYNTTRAVQVQIYMRGSSCALLKMSRPSRL